MSRPLVSLADPQSFNRYSYVGNDPTNFIDPSGLDAISDAVGEAQDLLRFAPCERLVSRGRGNASRELANIRQRGQIYAVADRYPTFRGTPTGWIQDGTAPFNGEVARTQYATYTPLRGRPTIRNVGIYIDSNGQFFTAKGSISIYSGSNIYLQVGDRNTLTILHELMHWMGRPGGKDHSKTFNQAIYSICFFLNPNWAGRNREPVETTPGELGTVITTRPPEPESRPSGGWGQADWSFFLLLLLSMSINNTGGTVTVTGYCVNGDCHY
ncbi:MAG: hypothetical protein C4287_23425 [Leptolyngbya sp. ERB_1_2]